MKVHEKQNTFSERAIFLIVRGAIIRQEKYCEENCTNLHRNGNT